MTNITDIAFLNYLASKGVAPDEYGGFDGATKLGFIQAFEKQKMACNFYIEQIERAGGNISGNCSCGQPVGSHLHETPAPTQPGIISSCEFHCVIYIAYLHTCILLAFDEFHLMR